ncbi:MAG: hypothetical protein QM791_15060 [Ferruginibacter sp.]
MSQNWQDKIKKFEQAPPEGAWENIAGKLGEQDFQSRLSNYEAAPPAAIWENINNQLNTAENETGATIVPMEKTGNSRIIWRIAIAASVIALVFLSVFYLDQKKTQMPGNIAKQPEEQSSNSKNSVADVVKPAEQSSSPIVKKEQEVKDIRKVSGRSRIKAIPVVDSSEPDIDVAYVQPDQVSPLVTPPVLDKTKKLVNTDGTEINDIAMLNSPNTYITITGPNGDQVRVSSKFANLINYINDKLPSTEEYLDKVIKEGKFWRGKFKSWRDKMANNTLAPNPTNFMDIVELSKLVKE